MICGCSSAMNVAQLRGVRTVQELEGQLHGRGVQPGHDLGGPLGAERLLEQVLGVGQPALGHARASGGQVAELAPAPRRSPRAPTVSRRAISEEIASTSPSLRWLMTVAARSRPIWISTIAALRTPWVVDGGGHFGSTSQPRSSAATSSGCRSTSVASCSRTSCRRWPRSAPARRAAGQGSTAGATAVRGRRRGGAARRRRSWRSRGPCCASGRGARPAAGWRGCRGRSPAFVISSICWAFLSAAAALASSAAAALSALRSKGRPTPRRCRRAWCRSRRVASDQATQDLRAGRREAAVSVEDDAECSEFTAPGAFSRCSTIGVHRVVRRCCDFLT